MEWTNFDSTLKKRRKMKPQDRIKRLISKSKVVTSPESDKRILGDALTYLEKLKQPGIWSTVICNPIGKLAVISAAIIVTISFFIVYPGPNENDEIVEIAKVTALPADMQSILSLNIAYRRGGMKAVDRQYQIAAEMLGPRPAQITMKQILTEFNGT